MLLGHIFSNSIAFTLINKYAKAPVFQIWTVFGTVCHVAFWRSSEKGFFRYLSNHGFPSPYFGKYISYEGHLFYENFQNFIYISKIPKKGWENVFPFRDNYISISYVKLCLLRRQYFWSAVNLLKNSLEILPIIKRDFLEINRIQSHQWILQMWCHSEFSTVWYHLPCWLSKGPLKRDFLDIYLTMFFGIHNFQNTSAMRFIFLLKVFKIFARFQKRRKKLRKLASQLPTSNCLY